MTMMIRDILMGEHPYKKDVPAKSVFNTYITGENKIFSKGNNFTKIYEDETKLVFLNEMEKDAYYDIHYHSDLEEFCSVIQGILHDTVSGHNYTMGETARFTRGVPHGPIARTKVLMTVTFYRKS